MKQTRLPRGSRRVLAVVATASVLVAGVVVINRDSTDVAGFSALPRATGQPAPTGPTGGSGGGGMSAPPFPLQPPDMPGGPPNGYNSGSYPAPDQGNGISIYNSGAPQSPSGQGGYNQAPSYPQQQLQPANGTQPPNYDAPLQTQPAQPSVAPSVAQQPSQQAQPSQDQQSQPSDQNQRGDEDSTQRRQQCQQAADFYRISEGSSVWKVGAGAGGSMVGGRPEPGRDLPGAGQCNCAPEQAGPHKQSPDDSQQQCTEPGFSVQKFDDRTATSPDGTVVIDQTRWLNAMKIITQVRKMKFDDPKRAETIALMTSLRESHLENLGNYNTNPVGTAPGSGLSLADREYSYLFADTDPTSEWYTQVKFAGGDTKMVDAGADSDSVGLFQQRPWGWGTVAERMDPWTSARLFLDRLRPLLDDPDEVQQSNPKLAQDVQHSDPSSYRAFESAATELVNKIGSCPNVGRQE